MLITAYEQVASLAKHEARKAQVAQELCEQTKHEMQMTRCLHKDTEIGLRTASVMAYEQLAEAQHELKKAWVEAEVCQLRIESVSTELELARSQIQDLEGALETRAQSEEGWRDSFLQSTDFKWAVSDRSYSYFKTGFDRYRDQLKESGLIPPDREDFPTSEKDVATLPDDEDKQQQPVDKDIGFAGSEDIV